MRDCLNLHCGFIIYHLWVFKKVTLPLCTLFLPFTSCGSLGNFLNSLYFGLYKGDNYSTSLKGLFQGTNEKKHAYCLE